MWYSWSCTHPPRSVFDSLSFHFVLQLLLKLAKQRKGFYNHVFLNWGFSQNIQWIIISTLLYCFHPWYQTKTIWGCFWRSNWRLKLAFFRYLASHGTTTTRTSTEDFDRIQIIAAHTSPFFDMFLLIYAFWSHFVFYTYHMLGELRKHTSKG